MEILFVIGGFFLLFILIAPLINAFSSNSPHKNKSQDEKKEQALKDIKKNYDTSSLVAVDAPYQQYALPVHPARRK
jgi:hypothetical protein